MTREPLILRLGRLVSPSERPLAAKEYNNNSLHLNTVKTDGSCTADVAVYYNTKQYSTIQYLILCGSMLNILDISQRKSSISR